MTESSVPLKRYRFTRGDFAPLHTKPLHLEMVFDMYHDKATVLLYTTFLHTAAEPLAQISLNAKELQIDSVKQILDFIPLSHNKQFSQHVQSFKRAEPLKYEIDTDKHLLIVHLREPMQCNQEFVLETRTTAIPSDRILEGLYYDYTPQGAPRTIITQCQQHGFQRIVPCIDTMDAKAYYTVTIAADKRYTNIITNGDLAPEFHDNHGRPVFHSVKEMLGTEDASRHVVKYQNHTVTMAPYLFFLGVGTYETYQRTLEFPDGDCTMLEILAFPGFFEPQDAKRAVQMLHDSVLWTMISLGPEACEHESERQLVYKLIDEREAIKEKYEELCLGPNETKTSRKKDAKDEERLSSIRKELKELLKVWTKMGYKYTGAVYREIAMENSYYGGMENVGNTTIISSCLCPSCRMDDRSYEYMEAVKVHEYYHNINGSQVTGQSPFEIWLNEAVTVHMERKRCSALLGSDYMRLKTVMQMFTPAIGPLAQDKSATSLSIEPQGFNQSQELVSAVTYSKAPEFVRMVEQILGEPTFHKALDHYHTKFSLGNATTMDWMDCMMEISKKDLKALARTWLKRPCYPEVTYSTTYDVKTQNYTIRMRQTGFEHFTDDQAGPWYIPIDYAVIKNGSVLKEGFFIFSKAESFLVIENVQEEPDYVSFARGWSFFGTSKVENPSVPMLIKQAETDADPINRYQAYRMVADQEKANVIQNLLKGNRNVAISTEFIDLHACILFSEGVSPSTRALTLTEKNSIPSRDELSHHYIELNQATRALLQAVYSKYTARIDAMYARLCAAARPGRHDEQIKDRALKRHLFAMIIAGSRPLALDSIPAIKQSKNAATIALELIHSPFVSDKVVAFRAIMEMEDHPDRAKIQEQIFKEWRETSDMMSHYIVVICSLEASDVGEQIRHLIADPHFKMELSKHSRTLAISLSQIRYYSLATNEGLQLMKHCFEKIGKVNQMSAYPILQSFDHLERFEDAKKRQLLDILQEMQDCLDSKKEESLYNQLNIILKKA